ncbi:MAG: TnsD family Tn7-like transposition protein [Aquabacterium sp.]
MQGALQHIGTDVPWLPDETLYSWCSRYHRLAANGLAGRTSSQLFGSKHPGLAHDLPAGLTQFVQRTSGSLGDVQTIIRDRTVLPFYLPLRSLDLAGRAWSLMGAEGIGSLKFQLGLLTSGLGAAHPLKACPACTQADLQEHAVAYWHRSHQLPGVWICLKHHEPLMHSPIKLDQRGRFQWVLPSKAELVPLLCADLKVKCDAGAWLRMAEFSVCLAEESAARLAEPARIRHALRHAMQRYGWIGASGRISWLELQNSLGEHAGQLATMPPLAGQLSPQSCRSQLSRILQARALTHPLRYLVPITWLFEDWVSFLGAYDHDEEHGFEIRAQLQETAETGVSASMLDAIEALSKGRESATGIARRLGVSTSTVVAWGARVGIETPRRPKLIHDEVWNRAVDMLEHGADKSEIACACGMSEVSVTRILRSVPGLQDAWHRVRWRQAQEQARSAWLATIAAQAWLGVSGLRRLQPSTYAWLYRNDRDWLRQQCANVDRVAGGNNAASRMRIADRRYSVALQKMWRSLEGNQPEACFIVPTLLLQAPGLRKVFKRPDRWPITMGVVREMVRADRPTSNDDSLSL